MQTIPCRCWFRAVAVLSALLTFLSCGGSGSTSKSDPPPPPTSHLSGILSWKSQTTGNGEYTNETTLTPANVGVDHLGKVGNFVADGLIEAQPLYIRDLDMGSAGTHDVILIVTENDSIYALDVDHLDAGPIWHRNYLDPANGVTPMPDNVGGRTSLGGEIGITGTPVIDPASGAVYFVTALARNGVAEQWLRAVDVRTGNDFGAGSMRINASVPGDGVASVNGQITFDPSIGNQRAGLREWDGSILVAWGSFSDQGEYHGWLMAFDAASLERKAVFNPTPNYQADDPAYGSADHGGGGSFWQGSAAPTIDTDGYIYLNSADGSFNANQGGNNYGDTMLKLRLAGDKFEVVDWFTPFNQACIDVADLEIGSGGIVLLPASTTGSSQMAVTVSKEGRFYLVNTDTMGHYNPAGDSQIIQEFMIGEHSCTSEDAGGGIAEGPGWNRLYGNISFWNGNMYVQASSLPLKQYRFSNGSFNPTPFDESPTAAGLRGANTVVSSNGDQNGIVWAYEKALSGQAILHAYDATMVSRELWNSNMNALRDQLSTGIVFAVPVVADGRVIVANDVNVSVFAIFG